MVDLIPTSMSRCCSGWYRVGLLVGLFLLAGPQVIRAQATYTVNTTGDGSDTSPGDGFCSTVEETCTLRAAIQEANATANEGGPDVIEFDISGDIPHVIQPNTALPEINEPVVIDGTSEPDYDGSPVIELDGTDAGDVPGFDVAFSELGAGGGITARGLAVVNFAREAFRIGDDAGGNIIQGCYIGVRPDGTTAAGNDQGIFVSFAPNTTIGGVQTGDGNVISGNNTDGIVLSDSASVQGNSIGVDANGNPTGNGGAGISTFGPLGNGAVIGGTGFGEGNIIAHNGADGVVVEVGQEGSSVQNSIRGNQIFANDSLGIDLVGGDEDADGRTANDDGDGDDGPNRLQNFPDLQSSSYNPDAEEVTVTYLVPSDPNIDASGSSNYPLTIDFYVAGADNEEGRAYLGTDTYSSADPEDYGGCGSPPCTVTTTFTPQASVDQDDDIVATATDDNTNTSEFSLSVPVNDAPTASFTFAPGVPDVGETVTFDAGGSSDEDGQIVSYEWAFGDGTMGSGETATHSYDDAGSYTATLTVTDDNGAIAEASAGITLRPAQVQVSVARTFGARRTENYRLVALPGRVEQPLGATISGFWRGFREEGATGSNPNSRSECNDDCGFGAGKGFWLIATQSWQVDRTVQTSPLGEDGTVRLAVQNGWNIVSNPLEVDVPWSAVQEATGTSQSLWRWAEGRWEEAETFRSAKEGVAYYFMDDQVSELTVPFSVPEDVSAQAEPDTTGAEKSGGKKQALTLSVMQDKTPVSSVEVGVRSGAKEGLDRFDLYGPPGYFGEAVLRLMEKTETRRHALAAEYQGSGGEGQSFDLVLQAAPDTAVTLRASGVEAFAGQEILLVERATGRSHDLRERPEVGVVPRSEKMRFRLLVGSRSFVEEKRREITPEEGKLLPNYPNPVRAGTTIEYALPETQHVRLEVYDALGRRVGVLVEEQKRAGFHRVRWRGGAELPSGVYFYRLRLDEKTKVRKMTVVR